MGFYNVQNGDAPYLKSLADAYAMSDNYHQAVKGGTGANHIMLGTGDAIWFSNGAGAPQEPPHDTVNPTSPGTPPVGETNALSEIENPNPQPGTNNYYIQDGYGGGSGSPTAASPKANYGGGSYVNCADPSQPGVEPELNYLHALPHPVRPELRRRSLLSGQQLQSRLFRRRLQRLHRPEPGQLRLHDPAVVGSEHRRRLNTKNISWAYFGDQFDRISRRQI